MMDRAGQPVRSAFSKDPEMQHLLQLFVDEMPQCVDALSTAFTEKQSDELARLTKQLKGSGDEYGFAPISDAARILEDALCDTDPATDDIRKALDDLVEYCSRAIA